MQSRRTADKAIFPQSKPPPADYIGVPPSNLVAVVSFIHQDIIILFPRNSFIYIFILYSFLLLTGRKPWKVPRYTAGISVLQETVLVKVLSEHCQKRFRCNHIFHMAAWDCDNAFSQLVCNNRSWRHT